MFVLCQDSFVNLTQVLYLLSHVDVFSRWLTARKQIIFTVQLNGVIQQYSKAESEKIGVQKHLHAAVLSTETPNSVLVSAGTVLLFS